MTDWKPGVKLIVRIAISTVLLVLCLVLVLGNYPDDYKKWAFGIMGIILGYWLR